MLSGECGIAGAGSGPPDGAEPGAVVLGGDFKCVFGVEDVADLGRGGLAEQEHLHGPAREGVVGPAEVAVGGVVVAVVAVGWRLATGSGEAPRRWRRRGSSMRIGFGEMKTRS